MTTKNTPITDAELAELRRLHAAALFRYGVRDDESAWYSIGDPKTGPHIQGDIYADEQTLVRLAAVWSAFPGLLARLEAAERERDELAGIVKSPEYRQMLADQANLPARDASMKREGAAEWLEENNERLDVMNRVDIIEEAKRLREGGE